MRISEDDRIGRWQVTHIVAAFDEPFRLLAVCRTVFRDGLIEAHQRSAAAMSKENHFGNAGLLAHEFHGRFDIQRRLFPSHLAFIVLKSGVETKREKATAG